MARLCRTLLVASLTWAVVGLGCDRPAEDKVPAIDPETGATATVFAEDLPRGWVVCSDPSCLDDGQDIPCLNRAAAACEQDGVCRSQLLSCDTKEEFELAAVCARDPAGPGCAAGPVPGCAYACVEIDRCPEVQLAEADRCPASSAVPTYDPSGCLTGFRCLTECPTIEQPVCASSEEPSAITDTRSGCVIGFECDGGVKSAIEGFGGATTLSSPAPASLDSETVRSSECGALSERYEQTLTEAKSCRPPLNDIAPRSTCGTTVPNSLKCGCPTYVNSAQTDAYEKLQTLRRSWLELSCDQNIYCARVACDTPKGATCVTTSGDAVVTSGEAADGTCKDL